MTSFSLTQAGNAVALAGLISTVFQFFGVELAPKELETVIIAVGIAISWFGRWRKGDLTLAGFRR